MHDVFVSYAHEDRRSIEAVVAELERHDLVVWWDDTIHTGSRYDTQLDDALAAARCIVVCWSPDAVRSDWVKMEAQFGLAREKLIPLFIAETELPPPFHRLLTADLRPWLNAPSERDVLDKTLRHIFNLVDRSKAAEHAERLSTDPFSGRPAIAVLPLENSGRNQDEEYLSDGITEDIISRLQRFRTFSIIASVTMLAFKDSQKSSQQIAAELQVDYLVVGSVRMQRERLRIKVELIDAANQTSMVSEVFDRAFDDLFDLQDEISLLIAAKLEPEIERAEQQRHLADHSESLSSWELVRRGMWHQYRLTREDAAKAYEHFMAALEIDAHSVEALVQLGWWHFWKLSSTGKDGDWSVVARYARDAGKLDPNDSRPLELMGIATFMGGAPRDAIPIIERAIALNPSYAWAHAHLGSANYLAGDPVRAIEHITTALAYSPLDLFVFHAHGDLAVCHYMLEDWSKALEHARISLSMRAGYWLSNVMHIAALGRLGRADEGARALNAYRASQKTDRLGESRWLPFEDTRYRDAIIEGMEACGWSAE